MKSAVKMFLDLAQSIRMLYIVTVDYVEVYCEMDPSMPVTQYGLDVIGHFSHCFYKPYNVTVDFTDMNLYIARGKAS